MEKNLQVNCAKIGFSFIAPDISGFFLNRIAKDGFHKITMKDICEATGMSRGGLYSHFGSTRELYEAILEKINQKNEMNFQKEIEDEMSAADILERALALMKDEMEHVNRNGLILLN